jgi:hypothetical protein
MGGDESCRLRTVRRRCGADVGVLACDYEWVPSALPAIESTDLAQVTRGREGRCEWSERTPPWSSEISCHLTVLPSRAVFGGEVPLGSRLSRRPTSCQSAVARNPSRRVGEDGFVVAGEAPKSLYRWWGVGNGARSIEMSEVASGGTVNTSVSATCHSLRSGNGSQTLNLP